jgi:septal ring factor EnvC (AmiA/AmiB activator)
LNLHYQTTKNQLMMLKKNLLLLAFAIIGLTVSAQQPQSKEDLQKQQQQLQKEISELNKTLSDIQKNKKRSLGELTAVKRKIAAREQMVNNISRDMKRLDDNIYLTNLDIYRYTRELDTLKQQYAQSLVFAYKNRSNYDYLNFIFSASNFNDAIKRVQYLKSYRRQRETQVSSILKTQQVLQQKISILNTNKNEKNLALQEQSKTLKELENDRKEKDKVVTSLKSQEKDLAAQIKRKDKERRDLANAISSIIKRELAAIKKKEEDDRKKALANANANKPATTPSTTPKTTPSGAPATSGLTTAEKTGTMEKFDSPSEEQSLVFESNRGRLPWPVDAGYVSIDFGTYELPGTKLKGVSDGIEITLPVGSGV